jgi:guanine nucleotide-binding protein subunit alpha
MGLCGSKHDLPPPKQSNTIASISNPASITNSGKSNTPNSVCVNQGANDINKDKCQKSERNNSVTVQSFNEKDSYNNNNRNRQNSSLSKSNDSTEKSISKVVNKPLTQAKILLLGSGESGKSTILKQIKIIHQNGFSDNEKFDYKPFVYQNICESAQCIIKALQKYDLTSNIINLTSDELETLLNYQVPLEIDVKTSSLDPIIADLIEKLISDQIVIDLLSKKEYEFYILDSSTYFFENLQRIKAKDYLPTVTDILRTRKQTSGIFDTRFQMEDLDIHLFDVGGQRSERKKWIHCFDNVTAIIFCVALSEYDQTLLESPNQNRLEESLNLFESVVNSMWFRRTAVILCLNKIDIFIEKLPNSPMEKHFPDYVGGANVNKAVKYILWRFKQLNRANLNLVPYVSQATDTNNIRLAFAIVRETILHNNLLDSGIINS